MHKTYLFPDAKAGKNFKNFSKNVHYQLFLTSVLFSLLLRFVTVELNPA